MIYIMPENKLSSPDLFNVNYFFCVINFFDFAVAVSSAPMLFFCLIIVFRATLTGEEHQRLRKSYSQR